MSARIVLEQPSESDVDVIHGVLAQTYWSPGIPRGTVARGCENSICAIARDAEGELIGFARVISDKATFAWLCDVMVLENHRGHGIGRDLVRALQEHEELQGLRRWLLATRDAHGVYAPLGFTAIEEPQRLMHIRRSDPIDVAAS